MLDEGPRQVGRPARLERMVGGGLKRIIPLYDPWTLCVDRCKLSHLERFSQSASVENSEFALSLSPSSAPRGAGYVYEVKKRCLMTEKR
jgi:hypothetical protein